METKNDQMQEFDLNMKLRILNLRIQALENQMVNNMDPFGPEFDAAAEKLRELRCARDKAAREKCQWQIDHSQFMDI